MLLLLLPACALTTTTGHRAFCKPLPGISSYRSRQPGRSSLTPRARGLEVGLRSGVCVLPPAAALTFFPPARAFVRLVWRTPAVCTAQQPDRTIALQPEAQETWSSSLAQDCEAPCQRRSAARAANAAIEVGWDGSSAAVRDICACRHNCVHKNIKRDYQFVSCYTKPS